MAEENVRGLAVDFEAVANSSADAAAQQFAAAKATEEVGKQAQVARGALLFLSFGLMAAGGLFNKAASILGKATNSIENSFERIQYQATVVGTVLGGTAGEISAVQQEMLKLGRTTEYTAYEAGTAMRELAMAGFDLNETLGATEGTLKLATIGLIDTTSAANIAVGVLRGFNLETSTAAETTGSMNVVVAELAQASSSSASTVSDLAESLKYVAAMSSAAGISIEETLAVLMVSSDNMIRAGLAGRALRQSLIKLQQASGGIAETTKGTKEMMDALGITLVDQNGQVKSLAEIVDLLNKSMEGMGTAEKNTALAALFGSNAITMWSALMREGGDEIRKREVLLTAAASKEAIFMRTNEDATQVLMKWRKQVKDLNVDTEDLRKQLVGMGYTTEEIDAIITTITADFEGADEAMRKAAVASEITRTRLATLHGTVILMHSSLDALWASLGQEIVPLFMYFNKILRWLTDTISQFPAPIKMIIALFIVGGYVTSLLTGKILMTVAAFVMLAAALVQLNKHETENLTITMMLGQTYGVLKSQIMSTAGAVGFAAAKFVILSGLVMLNASIFWYASVQWEQGNKSLAAMIALVGVLNTLYVIQVMLKNMEIVATLRAAKAYIAETVAKWANVASTGALTASTAALAIAQRALPILFIVGAIIAISQGMWGLVPIFLIVTAATWAWNAALWANPIMAIVGAIGLLIAALSILLLKWEEVNKQWKAGWKYLFGSPDTIFDYAGNTAAGASKAVSDLNEQILGANAAFAEGKENYGFNVSGPKAPPIQNISQKVTRVVSPQVNISFGRVDIGGTMSDKELSRVVSKAAEESMKRWQQSFDAEAAR